MKKIAELFKNTEIQILSIISILLAANSLIFATRQVETLEPLKITYSLLNHYFYFIILSLFFLGTIFFFNKKIASSNILLKFIAIFFPSAIILYWGTEKTSAFHWSIDFLVGFFFILTGFFFIKVLHKKQKNGKQYGFSKQIKNWIQNQGKFALGAIILIMGMNFLFGFYNLSKFAAVDEPLWMFERIERYWRNIGEKDWNSTKVNDKPGITVAIISGAGLLFDHPDNYPEQTNENGSTIGRKGDIKDLHLAFRLPILLFSILMIPLFYFLLERLLGKNTALFSVSLIGLSPVLLGISRIVNPDSLFWIFAPLTLLSFFNYQKTKNKWFLYGSGLLMGLSLLTKYVANLLFIFIPAIMILEWILSEEKIPFYENFKKLLLDLFIFTFIAFSTIFLLLPETWVERETLKQLTNQSEALAGFWPILRIAALLILLDFIILKSRILSFIAGKIKQYRSVLGKIFSTFFIAYFLVAIINTYLGMNFFNFDEILSSPKSSYKTEGYVSLFFANAYPLIFGILPLAAIAFFYSFTMLFEKDWFLKIKNRIVIYFGLFIAMYYVGTTFSGVAATVRYQIVIYPIALIIAAIGINNLISLKKETRKMLVPILAILIISGTISLFFSKPFYFSYASSLLPKQYILNPKDMGDGSYEAAQFINSLENPNNLIVWTDKEGVCSFLKARCISGLDYKELRLNERIDYAIISSGRENKIETLSKIFAGYGRDVIYFNELYDKNDEDVVFKIEINGRPNNFIKIIKFNIEDYEKNQLQ